MRINIHSIVDVITNSSTTIFTYQNSIKEAKELVAEMLSLMGSDETPDDVFYYGLFYDDDYHYIERAEDQGVEIPEGKEDKWLEDLKISIMTGEIERPEWMDYEDEIDGEGLADHLYLELIPKDEKYKTLGRNIEKLLCSVDGVESCT